MTEFAGAFGASRRAHAMARLYGSIIDQSSVVIGKVGGDRAGEISAHRALSSPQVTPEETLGCWAAGLLGCWARATALAAAGRRIVVAQDTTEVNFAGRQSRGLGPAGLRDLQRGKPAPGFFIHAAVAVDADAVLGLAHAEIWTCVASWKARQGGNETTTRRLARLDELDRRPAGQLDLLLQASGTKNRARRMAPLTAFVDGYAPINANPQIV